MPELSDILRQRLGAEEDPKTHPDVDTLTAYAEELLPATERREVLLHISLCNQCRDVVALTMPERAVAAEEPEIAVAAPALPGPRRAWRWFLTPRFGLVASLVAVAVGVTLVLELPQQSRKLPATTASMQRQEEPLTGPPPLHENGVSTFVSPEKPSETANAPAARLSAAAGERSNAVEKENKMQMLAAAASKKTSASGQNQPVMVAGMVPKDYVNNQVFASQLFAVDSAGAQQVQELPSAPRPARPTFALSQMAGLTSGSFQTNAFLEFAPQGQGRPANNPAPNYEHQGFSITMKITQVGKQLRLKRLSPAITTENANSYAMFSPGLSQSRTAEMTAQTPENAPTGAALAQSPAFTSRGMRGSLSVLDHGTMFLWKVVQGRLLKSSDMDHWADGYPASEGVEFSVVTANGADVWAGGKDAALVHSRDGGVTWERITLGASATGRVTSIEVTGSSIQVRSSSGQGWLSQDGGRSWSLQN